jgi:stage IV sporulation protein FA
MHSRADEVRKRIAKRKRERVRGTRNSQHTYRLPGDEETHGFEKISSYEGGPEKGGHPLFSKEMFLFKILASASLVLIVAIIFRLESSSMEPVKNFVTKSMEEDFQFAAVSKWYEDQFGKPLALLPQSNDGETENDSTVDEDYALPAAGRVLEDFEVNGQSITVETEKGAGVVATNEGFVRFAGKKDGFGKTVIIQHADKSETWYGNLSSIDVSLYEFVKKEAMIGKTSDNADGTKGSFYFAIKKGDDFIDPIQVIQFE